MAIFTSLANREKTISTSIVIQSALSVDQAPSTFKQSRQRLNLNAILLNLKYTSRAKRINYYFSKMTLIFAKVCTQRDAAHATNFAFCLTSGKKMLYAGFWIC